MIQMSSYKPMDDSKEIIAHLRGLKCHHCGTICIDVVTVGSSIFCSEQCKHKALYDSLVKTMSVDIQKEIDGTIIKYMLAEGTTPWMTNTKTS